VAAEWSCQTQKAGTSISKRTVPQAQRPSAWTADRFSGSAAGFLIPRGWTKFRRLETGLTG
jgi:hypothetical protein